MARVPGRARPLGPLLCAALIASACADPRPYGPGVPECERCHGGGGSPAPPPSVLGYRGTGDRPVGAHRRHLEPHPGAVRAPIACDECHVVPERRDAPGHIDGAHATVTFGPLARAGLAAPSWDREALTCTATYCHGATLDAGGSNTAPVWTAVDEGQAACGTCHGNPPPAPHPASSACCDCHPGTVSPDGAIDLAGGQHIDGELDVGPLGCSSCHGSAQNPAPPVSTTGESATTAVAVGAHQAHLLDGATRLAVGCTSCHVLPASSAHADGKVDLAWSALAGSVTWDRAAATCVTYCHGATLGAGGSNTRPVWTSVGAGQAACGTCHGLPPPAPHPASLACAGCHPATVRADGGIDLAGGQHLDGNLDVSVSCGSCHGVPPATGAHLAHAAFPDASVAAYGDLRILEDYAPAGGPAYRFGCGHCHPIDPARHMDAVVQVDLSPAAPATGLRARNAAAAAYATGACSGVYCHSSGQAAPAYAATPAWTAAPGGLGCAGCHGNPPRYPSGGAGAATANSHLDLASDGYEFGHFLGMPGPFHSSRHGNRVWGLEDDAAPITCQTCHYETTDPSGAGPSGFYWLDTTGSYAVPGGAAGREAWLAEQQCGYCHKEGGAATGAGKVLPLRHVNGSRDVVFDPRPALPAIAWLPAAPNTPTAPYWMTRAGAYMPYPEWVTWNGSTVSFGLATATYDPATKRCGSVACHLAEQPVWGTPYVSSMTGTCITCHTF